MLTSEDPLIPVPIDLESYVVQAMFEDPTMDVWTAQSDYFHKFAVRMAGFDSVGTPLVPPDEHVLDHLARVWDLVDGEAAASRPAAATIACPVEDIECDLCEARARYETRVKTQGEEELIYACLECTRTYGDPVLGAGSSVYLMYTDEIPPRVRGVCDEIRNLQGKSSVWSTSDDRECDDDPSGHEPVEPLVQDLRAAIREELTALSSDVDRMRENFKTDEDGNYSLLRSEYDAYTRLVQRAKRLKSALGASSGGSGSPDAQTAMAPEPSETADTSPNPSTVRPSAAPISLEAKTVSVRLRNLWVRTVGPMLEECGHDLADAWTSAMIRRVGSEIVVRTPMDFGEGDPFAGELGSTIKEMITKESGGVLTAVSYEFADRPLPKLRRAKTSSLDIYHPEDVDSPGCATVAAALAARLAGAGTSAKPVLARLSVAGTSKFRVWLAVATEADRRSVGSTPGAAADLKLAVAKVQSGEPLYDIVVDPEAWQRYPQIAFG